MSKNLVITTLVGIISLIIGLGGGFFFRNEQLKRMRNNIVGGRFGGNFTMGTAGVAGRRSGGLQGATTGEIISTDDNSITIKMADGSTKIINLAESTAYSKNSDGSKSDLKVGTKVGVFGSPNSDGSVTAANIQINPMFDRMLLSPTPTN